MMNSLAKFLYYGISVDVLTLQGLDYAYFGQPFCWVATKPESMDLQTMDWAYFGQPFIGYLKG